MKILIIEDNPNNSYMLSFLLQAEGFEVFEADNGLTGIKLAKKNQPDIVLLDIQLPLLNGFDILALFKKDAEIKHIPIVVVSSYVMDNDKVRAIEAGAAGYVEKPIDPDTFVNQINLYLSQN